MGTLIEAIIISGDTAAMARVLTDENLDFFVFSKVSYTNAGDVPRAILKVLGAPSFDQDSLSFRLWWETEGKKKYEYLKKYTDVDTTKRM